MMTLDRLVAVKCSLNYHRKMTPRLIEVLIALSWLIPVLLTVMEGIIMLHTDFYTELKVRSVILGVFFTFGSISLCVSNGILYHCIYRQQTSICKTSFPLKNNPPAGFKKENDNNIISINQKAAANKEEAKKSLRRRDIKASWLCIWISVAFVICWAPLTGYRLSYVMGRTTAYPWLRRLSLCLASANSLANPIIYFMRRKDFQRYLKRMVSDKKSSITRSVTSYTS